MENRGTVSAIYTGDYMDNYDGDDGDEYGTNNRTAYRA
jgi:hypothetical protein